MNKRELSIFAIILVGVAVGYFAGAPSVASADLLQATATRTPIHYTPFPTIEPSQPPFEDTPEPLSWTCPDPALITPGALFEPTWAANCSHCVAAARTKDPIESTVESIEKTVEAQLSVTPTIGICVGDACPTQTITPTVTETPTAVPQTDHFYLKEVGQSTEKNITGLDVTQADHINSYEVSCGGTEDKIIGYLNSVEAQISCGASGCWGGPWGLQWTEMQEVQRPSGFGYTKYYGCAIDWRYQASANTLCETLGGLAPGGYYQNFNRTYFTHTQAVSGWVKAYWTTKDAGWVRANTDKVICYGAAEPPTATPTPTATPLAPAPCNIPKYVSNKPVVDVGGISIVGQGCFTIVPQIDIDIPFTETGLHLPGVDMCATLLTFPTVTVVDFTFPFSLFAVVPAAYLLKRIWQL